MNLNEIFCSVIMPVHNGENYLRDAIDSILGQTHSNFEFIIILNGCTDSSEQIIKGYQDQRIKLIIEDKPSQVKAYNLGFINANSEFIFIADQDDISIPHRIEYQLSVMIVEAVDVCGGFYDMVDSEGRFLRCQEVPVSDSEIKEKLLYNNNAILHSTICIKKSIFQKFGYYDENCFPSADYEFFLRISKNVKFFNIAKSITYWRIHVNQISSRYKKKTICMSAKISMDYLKNSEYSKLDGEYEYYLGLIYYYNNFLIKALYNFVVSLFKGYHPTRLKRYMFIIALGGFPLKVIRKYQLYNSQTFLYTKRNMDKYLFK